MILVTEISGELNLVTAFPNMAEGIHVTEKDHGQDSNTLTEAEPLWPNRLTTAPLVSTVKITIK